MQEFSDNFSMDDALQFTKTPAGQQLIALLKKADKTALQTALRQAADGNYQQAKNILSNALDHGKIQNILKGEGEEHG